MPPRPPQSPAIHEWVSFESDDRTWILDVTFLTSTWGCIWDAGCPGVRAEPTPDDAQGCCSYGAHFADPEDRDRVRRHAQRLTAEQWQHRRDLDEAIVAEPGGSADGHDVWATSIVDDACVFLNRPGFAGGHGCALHRGAIEAGESILEWKPEVCWQLPLRLEHHEDENGRTVSTLRQWRRHDWGEAGEEFAWWCTEEPLAFTADGPVVDRLAEEIVALVGVDVHRALVDYLARRADGVPVAHPALRGRR